METSWVTEDGQVTLPKRILDRLSIGPGTEVNFTLADDGKIIMEKVYGASQAPSRLKELRGDAGPGMSTDELMALTRGDYA